jgi:hypothetical protein
MMTKKPTKPDSSPDLSFESILGDISNLIDEARRSVTRSVNSIMTAAYWLIGRRIVEFEQNGKVRAKYGEKLLERLAGDLSARFGRGFSYPNLNRFRQFYITFPLENNLSTALIESNQPILSTLSREFDLPLNSLLATASKRFSLPWSAYVRLLSVKNENARDFYETEALRAGWSVRQLDRQIDSQFYERTALSKNKAAMLEKGQKALPKDRVLPEEAIKDPYVLEFLDLKDEYSENDLEEALIRHLETLKIEKSKGSFGAWTK